MKKSVLAITLVSLASALMAAETAKPAPAPATATSTKVAETAKPAPATKEVSNAAVKVEKMVVATEVVNKEPVGENTVFPGTTAELFAWVKLNVTEPAQVKFVWTKDGKTVGEWAYQIPSASASFRLKASKKVSPGSWKVELLSDKGESLSSAEFTVSAK